MPTQSLLPFVDCPDGLAQDILISNGASIPSPGCSMTPHTNYSEKLVLQSGGSALLSCMFCDQTFVHQDELGPHVLTEHPTTFSEPAVLRVEGEFRIPGERPRLKSSGLPLEKEETHSCIVCGQTLRDTSEVESHMRKHKKYFTYCCNVCGRRFREPWFLKNHMRKHAKAGGRGKAQQELEPPVTINGVVQEPPTEPVVSSYKICMACGFLFPDQDSLAEHSKIHNREVEPDEVKRNLDGAAESQKSFLNGLNLGPRATVSSLPERTSKWIPQLNPFVTYQAWQLATQGKVAVGPNNPKETGQEGSTDNDSGSEKEGLNTGSAEGQEDQPLKKLSGRERRHQQPPVAQTANKHRRSLIQKVKDKGRPTTCEVCQRAFRTYHQLVLHSRVHKRDKTGEESPVSPVETKQPTAASPEQGEGPEESFEDSLGLGEDGSDRSKPRSRQCTYCGKSFKSSYYLTVHLRTHTGEKPYKCVYCDYAAAQKTSLKYHLDRRHKNRPPVKIPSRPERLVSSSSEGKPGSDDEKAESNSWPPNSQSPEGRCDDACSTVSKPLVQVKTEYNEIPLTNEGRLNGLSPDHVEKVDIKMEDPDTPLNLSLKLSLTIPASSVSKDVVFSICCPFCPYTTTYPEVLMIHRRLIHKDKLGAIKRKRFIGDTKQRRFTGCPPALNGKDVPLLPVDRRNPRRTKSPPPPPANPQKPPVRQPPVPPVPVPVSVPVPTPGQDVVQLPVPIRPNPESQPSQESSRYTELLRKPSTGSKYMMDRAGMNERRSLPRADSIWHSDAARLCLNTQFGSLPQMDFGEPASKRMRLPAPPVGVKADCRENPGVRGPAMDGANRLLMTRRSVSNVPQLAGLPTPSEAHGVSSACPPLGAGLDSKWSMMNLLRPCTPSELAAFYHSTPPTPSHGELAPSRAGGRTVLYQHLPGIPNLQRRDPAGRFPTHRYGASDKSA